MIYKSVCDMVGKTPMAELTSFEDKARLFAKLELFNPAGSVKDRVAKAILDDCEKRGIIGPGSVIIEPTSGNTGIGLALIGTIRGYRVIIVMPDTMSKERILLMRAYGAEVVLTDGKKGMSGAIEEAERLKDTIDGAVVAGQFVNEANPMAHYNTTAPEIYEDMDGDVDIFVSCVGTGGTLTGVARYLKEKNKGIKIVAVEPKSSAVLSGGEAGPHKIQGIGAGFVTDITDTSLIDEIICVSDEDAFEYTRLLAKKEGILAGISSGAALCAACELAKKEENHGKKIAMIFPDTGSRYLSSDVFI